MGEINRDELKKSYEGFQSVIHVIIKDLESKRAMFVQLGEDATALGRACRECISTCNKIIIDIEIPHQRILATLAKHGMLVVPVTQAVVA